MYIYENGGAQEVTFAHSLSAPEQEQAVSWRLLSYSPLHLLDEAPTLEVRANETGGRVGVLSLTPAFDMKGVLVCLSLALTLALTLALALSLHFLFVFVFVFLFLFSDSLVLSLSLSHDDMMHRIRNRIPCMMAGVAGAAGG